MQDDLRFNHSLNALRPQIDMPLPDKVGIITHKSISSIN